MNYSNENDRLVDELLFLLDARYMKTLSKNDEIRMSNAKKLLDVYGISIDRTKGLEKALSRVKTSYDERIGNEIELKGQQTRVSLSNIEGRVDANNVNIKDMSTNTKNDVMHTKRFADDSLFVEISNVKTNIMKAIVEGLCVYLGSDITPVEYENHMSSQIVIKNKNADGDTLADNNMSNNIKPMGVGLISVNGLSFLLHVEGWSGGDRKNKQAGATATHHAADPMNVITVGPGITNYVSKDIVEGRHFTFEQIMSMYSRVIVDISNSINRICPNIIHISQQAVDMAISLAYNAGTSKLKRLANAHNAQEVADIIYNGPKTAAGNTLQGLVNRRVAESCIVRGQTSHQDNNVNALINAYMNPSDDAIQAMKIMNAK